MKSKTSVGGTCYSSRFEGKELRVALTLAYGCVKWHVIVAVVSSI
jgi:hypothetical protein